MTARWGDRTVENLRTSLEDEFDQQLRQTGISGYVREYKAVPGRRWRWDFAFPAAMLLVEVDGGTFISGGHNRGSRIDQDAEKQSTAVAAGWRTMRLTRSLIKSGRGLELIEAGIQIFDRVDDGWPLSLDLTGPGAAIIVCGKCDQRLIYASSFPLVALLDAVEAHKHVCTAGGET